MAVIWYLMWSGSDAQWQTEIHKRLLSSWTKMSWKVMVAIKSSGQMDWVETAGESIDGCDQVLKFIGNLTHLILLVPFRFNNFFD